MPRKFLLGATCLQHTKLGEAQGGRRAQALESERPRAVPDLEANEHRHEGRHG